MTDRTPLAPELRDEATDDVIFGLFAEGVSMSVIVEAVRGLTDSIHRDPAVHGDPAIERLCSELYNDLTKALESARLLEAALDDDSEQADTRETERY